MTRKDFEAMKDTARENNTDSFLMRKRIGSTTYEVYVYFSRTGRETLHDKILRMIRNEAGCK